jgi:hypothetical protein
MMRTPLQADLFEQRVAPFPAVGDAGNFHRHADVFVRGERRNQMEELKHEADFLAA